MVDVLFSFLCVLISIRCLGCSFKEIFRTLKDYYYYYYSFIGFARTRCRSDTFTIHSDNIYITDETTESSKLRS